MTRPYAQVTYNRRVVTGLKDAMTFTSFDFAIMQDGIDAKFREHETKLFVEEGASVGSPWAPLSPAYAERKRAAASGVRKRNRLSLKLAVPFKQRPVSSKILRFSENMMRSLTRANHSEHVSRTEGAAPRVHFVVGTTNELAHYHHDGNANLPARNPIAHTEEQKRAYVRVMVEYVLSKTRAVLRNTPRGGSSRRVA